MAKPKLIEAIKRYDSANVNPRNLIIGTDPIKTVESPLLATDANGSQAQYPVIDQIVLPETVPIGAADVNAGLCCILECSELASATCSECGKLVCTLMHGPAHIRHTHQLMKNTPILNEHVIEDHSSPVIEIGEITIYDSNLASIAAVMPDVTSEHVAWSTLEQYH